ncbi:unnamed protein product, partial [Aphanomyces euteiches]
MDDDEVVVPLLVFPDELFDESDALEGDFAASDCDVADGGAVVVTGPTTGEITVLLGAKDTLSG